MSPKSALAPSIALALLVLSSDALAKPPKPGKCSVASSGVAAEADEPLAVGVPVALSALLLVGRARRRR